MTKDEALDRVMADHKDLLAALAKHDTKREPMTDDELESIKWQAAHGPIDGGPLVAEITRLRAALAAADATARAQIVAWLRQPTILVIPDDGERIRDVTREYLASEIEQGRGAPVYLPVANESPEECVRAWSEWASHSMKRSGEIEVDDEIATADAAGFARGLQTAVAHLDSEHARYKRLEIRAREAGNARLESTYEAAGLAVINVSYEIEALAESPAAKTEGS